jgi:pyruvate,water dikinase
MTERKWIRWFDDLDLGDVAVVGGKNASLGELRKALTPRGVNVPDGFATTAGAYNEFLRNPDFARRSRKICAVWM